MSRTKKTFSILGIVLLSAFFYLGVWPFIVGGSHMESFCRSLTAGLSVAELDKLASEKGYRLTTVSKEQRALVHDSRSMGRFLCEVEFREGQLTSAKYIFND
ncbi:MAG: hypothetical protein AABY73_10480 [Pseudomonadota bacterium]